MCTSIISCYLCVMAVALYIIACLFLRRKREPKPAHVIEAAAAAVAAVTTSSTDTANRPTNKPEALSPQKLVLSLPSATSQ